MREKFNFFILLILVIIYSGCKGGITGRGPEIGSVEPGMGWNGVTNTITINGSGFGVLVAGSLSNPSIELPDVYILSQEVLKLDIKYWSPDRITATIPVNNQEGENFSLEITNPNGKSFVFPNSYTLTSNPCEVAPNFITITSVSPNIIPSNTPKSIDIFGGDFIEKPFVWLAQGDACIPNINGNLTVEFFDSTHISITIPSGLSPGWYSIVIINPNGWTARLDDAILIVSYTITVSGVYPSFGWNGVETPVYVYGDGFTSTPQIYLISSSSYPYELSRIAFIDKNSLSGVVPAGLPVGVYSMLVVNPDGNSGEIQGVFRVTQKAPPVVNSIVPGSTDTGSNPNVTIMGKDFRLPVRITLIDSYSNEVSGSCPYPDFVVSNTNYVSSTTLTAVINVSNCNIQAGVYLIRVMNIDEGSYYDWSAFVITNPASNPGSWSVSQNFMKKGRVGHSVVSGRDDLNRVYLYAMGGSDNIPPKAGGVIFKDIEMTQLDPFGRIGVWHQNGYDMENKRFGSGAVESSGWIYVVGGADFVNGITVQFPLSCTVEKARILTSDTAPVITGISYQQGGGSLSSGTWYYRVSAVMKTNSAENPGGEGLASEEWSIRVSNNSSVNLTWKPPSRDTSGVDYYRLYRTESVNGISGTERLIVDSIKNTYFTDIGYPAGLTTYIPQGSTGVWMCENSNGFTPVYGASVIKGRLSGGRIFIYSIGGNYGGGATGLVQYSEIQSDGSLSDWSVSSNTISPRYFLTAVFVNKDNAPIVNTNSYIYALGGTNDGTNSLNSTELSSVQSDGSISVWTSLTKKIPASMGLSSVAIDNFIFDMCGTNAGGNKVVSGEINNVNGNVANWNAAGNGATTIWSRLLGGSILETAYIYLIGGFGKCETNLCTEPSSGQALNTIEQVIW